MNLLDLALNPEPDEESAVADFTVSLFRLLGYVSHRRVARTHKDIRLFICEEESHAKTDVCLIDSQENDILLVVQEDKYFHNDALAAQYQLVAEAIAAFDYNNRIRRTYAGLLPLESKVCRPIISCVLLLTRRVDHGGHRSHRHYAYVSQDPRHYEPRSLRQGWLISTRTNHCLGACPNGLQIPSP